MRRLLVSLALASATAFVVAPRAHAEVRNVDMVVDPLGDCSGAETAEECMATSPIKKCADMKVTGYTSCVAKCTCQYNENVKKCDGPAVS